MKRYNKEQLLELTNRGEDVYLAFLDLESDGNGGYKHTLNPCYDDTKPSLMVKYDGERFRHHDYGGSPDGKEYSGDCFDFVAQLMGLNVKKDFGKIMETIAEKLAIELQLEYEINDYSTFYLYGYELEHADDKELLEFFKPYGVTQDILRQYNVRSIKGYKQLKDGKIEYKKMFSLVVGFEQDKFVKMYCPNPKRFWHLGYKDKDFLFGKAQIERRIRQSKSKEYPEAVILTGGGKDVLTLTALGLDAVSLNSETANMPSSTIEFLAEFDRVIVLYDNDETGIKMARQLVETFRGQLNIYSFQLPEELKEKGGKDVSDYVKLGLKTEKLLTEIDKVGRPGIVRELYESSNIGENECSVVTEKEVNFKDINSDDSFLSNDIFENLPELLKIVTDEFSDRRDKDLVLLSCLGVLSSLFPTVKGIYGGMKVGCNLFLLVSAPAASGKSAMSWARVLGTEVQKSLSAKYFEEYRNFRTAIANFKREIKENPELLPPVEPKQQALFIPANTSVSKMIELIGANEKFGILFETEADTLANALNSEWGDFSDVLRKVFHHETVSLARRANNEFVEVEKPHLSVVLSGTPNQVKNLLGGVENGFFSRFMFYDFQSNSEWKDQFISKDNQREKIFQELSIYVAEVWARLQNQNETIIELSSIQKARLNLYFDRKFKILLDQYGDDIAASVKRAGLVCYRLAMILTALKRLEAEEILPLEIEVSDNEFEISMSIVDTMLTNLEKVYSRLQNINITGKMNPQQKQLFEAVPNECSRNEFDTIVVGMNYNLKTGEKYLKDYIKMAVMERVKHGFYRKVA